MDPLARWFMPHQDNTRTGLMIGLASGKDSSLLHTYPLIPQDRAPMSPQELASVK
jgi:hypothetical protein